MTPFEIIILSIIYMICYSFVLTMLIEEDNVEDNVWVKLLWVIVSLALAIYAPLIIGGMLYNKLKGE